jgi:Flp pilus assembly pilin Flp
MIRLDAVMRIPFVASAKARIGDALRRGCRSCEGVAAVEFGLLTPVLLLMLVGTYEASRAISMDRRFNTITSMVGDLVSREQDMGDTPSENVATADAIMEVVQHVMTPYPHDTLEVEIIPVMAFGDGTETKLYAPSYKFKDGVVSASKSRCTNYTLPDGLVAAGGSVIVVEAKYTYKPSEFATWLFGSSSDWEDKATHSPRHSCVDFEGNNCVVSC